jgi:hypothetical protein
MTTKNTKRDPWELDQDAANSMKKMTKSGGSGGAFCPKRNTSIGKQCKACEALQALWEYPDGSRERKIASTKSAKVSYFMNVVLASDKTKSIVLEIGKKAGDYIINSIYDPDKNWKMVAHPLENKGFEVKIKKFKGERDFNAYDVFRGDTCDWGIPESVLESLTNLDQENVINMLLNGTLVEGDNFIRSSSLKLDETLAFRICPPWNYKQGGTAILTPVFRHWGGVTQAEIEGLTPVNISSEDEVGATEEPKKSEPSMDVPWSTDKKEDTKQEVGSKSTCFGVIEPMVFFDSDDPDCKECKSFEECGREVTRKTKKKQLKNS